MAFSPFSKDLVFLLEAGNVGIFGTTIFVGSKASLPSSGVGNPFLTIKESGGAPPLGTHNSTIIPAYLRPSAQIMARGEDAVETRALIQSAYNLLYPIRNRLVNGTWYLHILIKGDIMDLSEDEVARPRYAFNVDAEKRFSPETS